MIANADYYYGIMEVDRIVLEVDWIVVADINVIALALMDVDGIVV